ncbi:MAG: helix-hairpin-helix domain-containing protein [candidate division WOR-3 bacterium]|nr:helix-hairpin-helix domain-containing protein [candidate division WOR-3 bacterium]
MNRKEKLALILLSLTLCVGIIINYIKTKRIQETNKLVISLKDSISAKENDSSTTNNNSVKSSRNLLVNINTADAKELEALPGIGPVIAQRIVEYRKQNGYFKAKEEILRIKGIGPKKYQAIKDKITL